MLAVAIVSLLVAVALGVVLIRTNARLTALGEDLGRAIRLREEADVAQRAAEADAAQARTARDDALERADRAEREATAVARRLEEEADARAAAEAALADAQAAASGGEADAAALWALALAGVRRTWEVSVAPSPGLASPLDGSDDELRDAVAIEVDAAREEAGAAIELTWDGTAVVGPALAVRALALAQEVVGRRATAPAAAVLAVPVRAGSVELAVTGPDLDGAPAPVEELLSGVAPEHQVAPGRFELG